MDQKNLVEDEKNDKSHMWILPRPTLGKDQLYHILDKNEFFELLQHISTTNQIANFFTSAFKKVSRNKAANQPLNYRIVITDPEYHAIAVAEKIENIKDKWKWINEKLYPQLSKDQRDRDTMLKFLLDKFIAKSEDAEQETENNNSYFRNLFKLPNEKLITYYTCTLWNNPMHYPGTMYLSDNYICFFSVMLTQKLRIAFKDVTDIEKAMSFGAFDNAIKIITTSREKIQKEYFFGTLFARDITYSILDQLWNISMDKVFQAAAKKLNSNKNMTSNTNNSLIEESNETLLILEERYRCTHYNLLFKLPTQEELIDVHPSSIFTKNEYQKGGIYLSNNFICFNADEKEEITLVIPMLSIVSIKEDTPFSRAFTIVTDKNYQFIFSLVGIEGGKNKITTILREWEIFKKSNVLLLQKINNNNNSESLTINNLNNNNFNLPKNNNIKNNNNDNNSKNNNSTNIFSNLSLNNLFSENKSSNSNSISLSLSDKDLSDKSDPLSSLDLRGSPLFLCNNTSPLRLGDYLLLNPKQFSQDYKTREEKLLRKWDRLFDTHGYGLCMMKTQKFRQLLKEGIPNSLRARIWQLCSGSEYKQMVRPNYYKDLLEENKGKQSETIEEIERDLHRSFPEHPFFQTQQAINSLRNVLVSYSFHNSQIGYCQSMNIVAALLLLFMPEENVFWMMISICEDIVPQYYNEELFGSLIDQQIFELLLQSHMPNIFNKIQQLNIPLTVITLPWLLCLFIGYIPLEAALRTLDTFFHEGTDSLFAVGLAIFRLNEEQLMEITDSDQVVPLMRSQQYNADQLQRASNYYRELIKGNVSRLRNSQKHQAVMKMEQNSRQNYFKELSSYLFEKSELENIYSSFQLVLSLNHKNQGFAVNYQGFVKVLNQFFPIWKNQPSTLQSLFKFCSSNKDVVSFNDFVKNLSILLKGSLIDKFKLCFSLFDVDEDGKVDKGSLFNIFTSLLSIYKDNFTKVDEFVLEIFKTSEIKDQSIDLDTVIRLSFENNFFQTFFSITSDISFNTLHQKESGNEIII